MIGIEVSGIHKQKDRKSSKEIFTFLKLGKASLYRLLSLENLAEFLYARGRECTNKELTILIVKKRNDFYAPASDNHSIIS